MFWDKGKELDSKKQEDRNKISFDGSYSLALKKIQDHKGDIKSLDQKWGDILLHDADVVSVAGRNSFQQYLSRGGEGIIILAKREMSDNDYVVFKFALRGLIEDWKKDEHSKIVRNKLENKSDRKNEYFNEFTLRWIRGCSIQKQLHTYQKVKGLYQWGIIPQIVHVNKPPKLFCTMEFINGKSLLLWCIHSREDDRIKFFYKLCFLFDRLVHENNIVHSDIKAGNILVLEDEKTRESVPALLDFQISKDLSIETDITHINTRLGNPLYSSKEQWESSKDRSFSDDIVSLGILLWVIFARAEPELINKGNVPENIKELYCDGLLPLPLQHIFDRATCEKSKRYVNLTQMIEDVKRAYHELYEKGIEKGVDSPVDEKKTDVKQERQGLFISTERADQIAYDCLIKHKCEKKYVAHFIRATLALLEKPDERD